jgi:hypothetical protein
LKGRRGRENSESKDKRKNTLNLKAVNYVTLIISINMLYVYKQTGDSPYTSAGGIKPGMISQNK